MPILPRETRERLSMSDAEYRRLSEQHSQYAAQLEQLSESPYLSAEDIIQQITLKKLKLRVKDEMEQLASRHAQESVRR
jgi:uncharacterized protein YdcH (DUF465 family)